MIQPPSLEPPHLVTPTLYLLTNDDAFDLLYQKLEVALATGVVAVLQIRRKKTRAMPNGKAVLYREAKQIVALAKAHKVTIVINDDIELAAKLGVGVHLGQQDGSIVEAKERLLGQLIGRTCHDDIDLVKAAQSEGASYAAMGAIFASTTKPDAQIVPRQQLIEGCQQDIALCVIGGLTVENVTMLAGLPITYIAVVGDIMDLPINAIKARCHQWQQALTQWHAPAVL